LADYFLKLDGISGESRDSKHKDEIELVSFSWGVSQSGQAGRRSGGAGRAQFKSFEFLMKINKASPQLFLACASGKHIKEASLSVRRAGKAALEYLKIKFTDVLVSSYHAAGSEDQAPHEMVAFDFGRIELAYTSQGARGAASGAIQAGWDLNANKKI
jgi:type VI secretion system secreted protein Hcp